MKGRTTIRHTSRLQTLRLESIAPFASKEMHPGRISSELTAWRVIIQEGTWGNLKKGARTQAIVLKGFQAVVSQAKIASVSTCKRRGKPTVSGSRMTLSIGYPKPYRVEDGFCIG
jgi:hypothetical protein